MAFRFVQRPEYLAPGDRLLFREGRTKGLGIVKSVGYDASKPLGGGEKVEEGESEEGKVEENVEEAGAKEQGKESGKGKGKGKEKEKSAGGPSTSES